MVSLNPFASASGQQQRVTRFGVVEIKDYEDSLKHGLLLNGKEIFQYEGQSIDIIDVLSGRGQNYLIVGTYSGGIACPVQLVIIEVYKSGEWKVTNNFGSCSEPTKARLINDRVLIEMPTHIPHPDLLSKNELRSRLRTKEVYTWYKGKLTKKIVPR